MGQSNIAMRKRVSLTTYRTAATDTVTQATYYDYDLDGNVKNLYQQIAGLGIKRLYYEYDLISGKVNFVGYQNGKHDQFFYQYFYDADNRLTQAWSSIYADTSTYFKGSTLDPATAQMDVSYQYYLHGPLARAELGDTSGKVQGIDYAYTLQGWQKGVNSQVLNPALDMGRDSVAVAKDAYGYSLGYYHNDYKPIGGTGYPAFVNQYSQSLGDITGQSLYNGNISTATYAINSINSGAPVGYTYHYDQLNRIKKLRQNSGIVNWNNGTFNSTYSEDFTYDGNGNILSLLRSGSSATVKDSLLYQYNRDVNGNLTNNKLNWLNGVGNATNFGPPQITNNYRFDSIGSMVYDRQDSITNIAWSVYGKIQVIIDSGKMISYVYNTIHDRIAKIANGLTTWYIRDPQGNIIALYDNANGNSNWREQHLYGSARLGMWKPDVNLATDSAHIKWGTKGRKEYDLINQTGNVIATISDKRLVDTIHSDYIAEVKTAQDFYAFGAIMPGRIFNSDSTRFGFNGKENDNEVMGTGNWQDYGMRMYAPRIGRFPSVDPSTKNYPELTPYQFASNTPIQASDLDGEEADFKGAQLPPIEYRDYQTLNTKATIFVINTAVSIYNGLVDASELVVNENPVYNLVDHGRGYKKVYNQAKGAAVGVYNWTVNSSWDNKKQDLIDASHNPHVYEQIVGLAITHKLSDISPMAPADAPSILPEDAANLAKPLTKAEQLAFNKAISKISEKIVKEKLESQLGDNEILLEKPRVYINDEKGNLTKNYTAPDFAVIDRETGKIVKIVDAKNGEGGLSGAQEELDKNGGRFKGSKRAPNASPQNVAPKQIKIERTNVKSIIDN